MGEASKTNQRKTLLITGATSGLGLEAARQTICQGFHVVLTGRNESKGQSALHQLKMQNPDADASFHKLDLASLTDIRRFAKRFENENLVALLNNAGVMAPPKRMLTVDGHELQFATNHLGHFLLTALLMPALIKNHGMVTTVASLAARKGRIAFDDLNARQHYDPFNRYRQSKLANLMFALSLNRHCREHDLPVNSYAAHPGWTRTNIINNVAQHDTHLDFMSLLKRRIFTPLAHLAFHVAAQDVEMGVQPLLAPLNPSCDKDTPYFGPQGRGERRGPAGKAWIPPQALDVDAQRHLWQISTKLTEARFPFSIN